MAADLDCRSYGGQVGISPLSGQGIISMNTAGRSSSALRNRRMIAAVMTAPLLGGFLTLALPGEALAATQAKCSLDIKLDWGRGVVASTCTMIIGPQVKGAKMVNHHRSVLSCDDIRGQGNQHDIRVKLYGPWKPVGQTSTVKCPIRSSVAGFSQETN